MRLLRIYYNWLLVRLRIRKILPAFFITRIPVKECGEPLVVYAGVLMREAVAEMLAKARRNLPEGYEIIPVSGWRSAVEQAALQQDFCNRLKRKYPELTSADLVQQTKKWCADSGGHQTGGAVDVQLWYQGRIADCGTPYLSTSPDSETAEINRLSPEAMTNRRLLLQTMTEAGFVNYPAEWWHYCFGDQLYAAYHGEKYAFYGEIELYTPNSGKIAKETAALLQNNPDAMASLSRGEWSMLLTIYPQYACEIAWRKLNEPQARMPGIIQPWPWLRGSCWARLLAERPEFEKHCEAWEDFDAMDWEWLLSQRPEFANHCNWRIFEYDEEEGINSLKSILLFQPQLADYCRDLTVFEHLYDSPDEDVILELVMELFC